MTRDSHTGREPGAAPANDNRGEGAPQPFTPEQIRAALRPLVHLLARQAAREWLGQIANDNAPCRVQPKAKPGPETCPTT